MPAEYPNDDHHFHHVEAIKTAREADDLTPPGAEAHPHLKLARKTAHGLVEDLERRKLNAGYGYHVTIGSTIPANKSDPVAEQITVTVQIPRPAPAPDPADVAAAQKAIAELGK